MSGPSYAVSWRRWIGKILVLLGISRKVQQRSKGEAFSMSCFLVKVVNTEGAYL